MKNNFIYLASLAFFLIFFSCEKDETVINSIETNVSTLTEKTKKNSSADTLPTFDGLGIRLPDFPGGERKYAVSFCIGTKIYMGFGFNQSGAVNDFYEWDFEKASSDWSLPADNLWTKLPVFTHSWSKNDLTVAPTFGFAVNGKGYILISANVNDTHLVNELWEFNPETHVWTLKATPPDALVRYGAAGFSIGTKLYVGTGETYKDNWKLFRDFWEWDQKTDTWTKKADFPGDARAHAAGFSIGNKGYLGLGGEVGMGGGPVYPDFWEYDPFSDKWTKKANFKGLQLIDAIGFSAANKGYIVAGWDPIIDSTSPQEIWEWNQSTDSWTKLGIIAGDLRTGSVGGSIGGWGYLLTGQNISKEWESNPILSDFWFIDLTSN